MVTRPGRALAAVLLATALTPLAAAADSWSYVASPSPADAALYAVTCIQASNCWAVGRYVGSTAYQTLIEHYDGTSWTIVTSPNTSASEAQQLDGVACSSPTVCWAVGYVLATQSSPARTLIEENTGSGWTIVASPGDGSGVLDGITCTSARNCWAVGYAQRAGTAQSLI